MSLLCLCRGEKSAVVELTFDPCPRLVGAPVRLLPPQLVGASPLYAFQHMTTSHRRYFHCGPELFNYTPRRTHEVRVGSRHIGGDNPLRLQSMTTTDTNDVEASFRQATAIMDAGGDIVRLTTQGRKEAEALRPLHERLRAAGYDQPLVADVHFNPDVADIAAGIIEKVRINPGNYVDPARTFKSLEYTDEEYAEELVRLETRFKRLLAICREHGTAIRIGVNHGSLSDRIMSRYGDTPAGIVESCMEFLRVCVKEDFKDVVISIKASNTRVMVLTMRLLVAVMKEEGMTFPLHLGVTEAGEGEDGRLKSAAGIGALLCDGIGNTIRVSLSEAPEAEIPVAWKVGRAAFSRAGHGMIPGHACPTFNYLDPERRPTTAVRNIGGDNVPVVVSTRLKGETDFGKTRPDYIYCGTHLPKELEDGIGYIVDAPAWEGKANTYPVFRPEDLLFAGMNTSPVKFLFLTYLQLGEEAKAFLRQHPETVIIAQSNHANRQGELRAMAHELWREDLKNPVIFFQHFEHTVAQREDFQVQSAVEMSNLLFDGLTDGIMLYSTLDLPVATQDETAFGILQATRLRTTKTEYISCPGCGRTLFELQETIARVKAATGHLKGLKIGVMGCIVNGPGEMADADYGYVGAGRGKVSLYKGKVCVEKNIPTDQAVEKLLALIEQERKTES